MVNVVFLIIAAIPVALISTLAYKLIKSNQMKQKRKSRKQAIEKANNQK